MINNKTIFLKAMSKRMLLGGLVLLTTGSIAYAQQAVPAFTWQAPLPVVPASGFYHIVVTPAVAAKLHNNMPPDFRIYQGDKEVPYLLQEQVGGYNVASFESFPVTDNIREPGKRSTIVFHNANGHTLDHFDLVFKNARVMKTMRISGSNDKKNWYGVTDAFVFDPASAIPDASSTTLVKTIPIPSSDYAWYQVIIDDSTSAPVFIEKIGRYKTNNRATEYTAVPAPKVSARPGNNQHESTWQLAFDQPYLVRKLSFNITAPALYRRSATISARISGYSKEIAAFNLSSDQPAQVELSAAGNYDTLLLTVQNNDNPVLQISAINAWQQTIWLTANLQQGQSYLLKGGDVRLAAPVYDLAYFKDSVPANIPVIEPGAPVSIAAAVKAPGGTVTVFKSKWWIWVGIIAVVVFLVFIALKMLKEMQEKK